MSESLTPLAPRPYTAQKAREPYAEWKEKKLHAIETTDHALRALDLTTGMRSLPFELRDMIFLFVIYNRLRLDCSKGKTSILVAALRGTEFYDEVLKLWYRETFVRLGEGRGPNPYSLRDLKPATFLRLKKLRVDYKVSGLWFHILAQRNFPFAFSYQLSDIAIQCHSERREKS